MNTELRILILEDVPEDVELMKRELKKQKIQYSSQAVDNRKDFIAALEEFAPDIVLADQKLPLFDGLSALDIVKEKSPDIPFVFVTGTMGEEWAVDTMKRGASDYVLKDKIFRLGPAVKRALREKQEETKRKELEKAIKHAAEEWRTTFDSMAEGVSIHTIDGEITRANKALSSLFGMSPKELIGKKCYQLFHNIDDFHESCPMLKSIVSKQTEFFEFCEPHLNRMLSVFCSPLLDSDGEVCGVIHTVQDVTERKELEEKRKQAEKALESSETRYRTLFESAAEGIVIADIQTKKFRYANPAICKMLGYSVEELLGMGVDDLHTKEEIEHVISEFEAQARGEKTLSSGIPCLRKDRTILYANVSSTRALIDGIECNVGFFTDVTERKRAEDALQLTRFALDNAADSMVNTGIDGRFIDVNDAFCRSVGYSREELLSMSVHDIDLNIPAEIWPEFWEKLKQSGSLTFESRHRTKEGKVFPVEITASFFEYNGEEYHCWLARDITERKRVEGERILFRKLIDQSNDTIEVIDPETGRFVDVNEKGYMSLGYSREEFLSLIVSDIDPIVDQSLFKRLVEDLRKSGILLLESIHRRKDGSTFPVEINIKYVQLDREYLITVVRDITERKRAEEEHQNLITAIEHTNDSITVSDINRSFIFVNSAFERMTGYSREEVIGRSPEFLFLPYEGRKMLEEIDNQLIHKKVITSQMHILCKDGTKKLHDITFSLVLDKTGAIVNTITVGRDITEKIIMEQRLRQAQRIEAIGTLAGGIAHDFNNILASIIGFAELSMEEVAKDSQVYSDLEKIYRAGGRARDLITQILTFSRKHEEEKKPINIVPIVKEVLKLIQSTLPSTIEITHAIDPHCGTIMADPSQVHQIVMNLCTNAGHAMQEDVGVLDVTLGQMYVDDDFAAMHPGLKTGAHIKLSVSDTGHGMTPEIIEHIFEPYFTTKEKTGGTGLGLAVVHGIVNSYEGVITVYSKPGVGATFNVYVPVIPEEAQESEDRIEELPTGSERILFVDDEQNIVEIAERILTGLGYDVTAATSSTETLDLFKKAPDRFDLVISDMTMPKMTGDQMAKKMLKMRKDIPIIICTGYSERIMMGKVDGIGIRSIIMKPLNKSELARTVRNVLDMPAESS